MQLGYTSPLRLVQRPDERDVTPAGAQPHCSALLFENPPVSASQAAPCLLFADPCCSPRSSFLWTWRPSWIYHSNTRQVILLFVHLLNCNVCNDFQPFSNIKVKRYCYHAKCLRYVVIHTTCIGQEHSWAGKRRNAAVYIPVKIGKKRRKLPRNSAKIEMKEAPALLAKCS